MAQHRMRLLSSNRLPFLKLTVVIVVLLDSGSVLPAAEPPGDLYQIGIALNQAGMRGGWKLVGQPGAWRRVRAGAILGDRLYTAESDGSLRATKLSSGARTKIGGLEFGETR